MTLVRIIKMDLIMKMHALVFMARHNDAEGDDDDYGDDDDDNDVEV